LVKNINAKKKTGGLKNKSIVADKANGSMKVGWRKDKHKLANSSVFI